MKLIKKNTAVNMRIMLRECCIAKDCLKTTKIRWAPDSVYTKKEITMHTLFA